MMLKLIEPDISHKVQWEEIMKEWDDSRKRPRIFFRDTYEEVLDRVNTLKDKDDIENQNPKNSIFFLLNDKRIVGFYWLRHNLYYRDDAKLSGHIGYGIRPSERGKGFAKEGLRLVLEVARHVNIGDKILIACDDDNIPSAKVIEANGGIFESYNFTSAGIKRRRYWINLYQKEKELLQSLELELFTFDCRHNPERIDELLADDFFECGKSGNRFGKAECLESLPKESENKKFEARDMEVHMLSENLGQVRYICTIENQGESLTTSYRTSLWRKGESGWQMFYHQGTIIQK